VRSARDAARGRGVGVLVGAVIGGVWAAYGASLSPPWNGFLLAVSVAFTAPLAAGGIAIIRRARAMPAHSEGKAANRAAWRWFWLNLTAEIVLLNLAALALNATGRPAYLIPAISVVVGLHFLPMARFFSVPSYLWTGGAMIAVAAAAAAAISGHFAEPSRVVGFEALANAAILWATAAWGWRGAGPRPAPDF
jgi:hypothetical protein